MSDTTATTKPAKKPSENENIKAGSRFLRGTIVESLRNPITASVADADNALLKFHGTYMQDNRDIREERARQRLEPAFDFMIRIRAPGGVITTKQWLELDRLAHKYAGSQMRITTRQSLQFHGVSKWELRQTMHDINQTLLTTLAACGDINRNVMCAPNPHQSEVHAEVFEWARKLSDHLFPKTLAYHEIWVAGEKLFDSRNGSASANGTGHLNGSGTAANSAKAEPEESEPIYGPTYLPRKFKIAIAVPPTNDVDVFAHDIGLIAVIENGKLAGFNVSAGGGMGCTHGDTATYPNLGTVVGFCKPDQVIDVAEKILTTQRDFGDRSNRKHARLKYTIADRGIAWFTAEVNRRLGWNLQTARPCKFEHHGDRYGWTEGYNGLWHLNIYIEDGRVKDWDGYKLMSGLKAIAEEHDHNEGGEFRLTPNENLIIANIPPAKRKRIEELVAQYKIHVGADVSAVRRSSMACVAFPTCGLAMAESERYLPTFISKIEPILKEFGIPDEPIAIRITGCPNGCARPFLGEIGLVGVSLGKYNLYLGADAVGQRMNRMYKANIGEEEILGILKPMIGRYAKERQAGERFGDFVVRVGIVRAVKNGADFHS